MGLPAGITAAAPAFLSRLAIDRIVARIAEHLKPVGHKLLGGLEGLDRIGEQRFGVPQAFELHPVRAGVLQAEQNLAPMRATRTASAAL